MCKKYESAILAQGQGHTSRSNAQIHMILINWLMELLTLLAVVGLLQYNFALLHSTCASFWHKGYRYPLKMITYCGGHTAAPGFYVKKVKVKNISI